MSPSARMLRTARCVCTASSEKSQFEFSMFQKANERVELGVLSTWSATCDVSAGTFALAANYMPSPESSVKVRSTVSIFRLPFDIKKILLQHLSSKTWNSLPLELRLAPTFDTFRRRLKTYLFG